MEEERLVLCDTDVLIEFYKGNKTIIEALLTIGQENIVVSVVTYGELLYGAFNKRELKKISNDLSHLKILEISKATCECFVELMQTYTLSHNLKLGDGLIAATAITHNTPLFTLNLRDFKFIKEITLWNTSQG